jgi:hypothetical protein
MLEEKFLLFIFLVYFCPSLVSLFFFFFFGLHDGPQFFRLKKKKKTKDGQKS